MSTFYHKYVHFLGTFQHLKWYSVFTNFAPLKSFKLVLGGSKVYASLFEEELLNNSKRAAVIQSYKKEWFQLGSYAKVLVFISNIYSQASKSLQKSWSYYSFFCFYGKNLINRYFRFLFFKQMMTLFSEISISKSEDNLQSSMIKFVWFFHK